MSATAATRTKSRRAVPYRLTAPAIREHPLQIQITKMMYLEIGPPGKVSRHGVCWWSCDVEDYTGEVPYTRASRGLIKGPADFFILYRGQAHHPELKADDGCLSPEQTWVAAAVLCAGGKVAVVRNSDDLINCLDTWGIPRNRRTRIAA